MEYQLGRGYRPPIPDWLERQAAVIELSSSRLVWPPGPGYRHAGYEGEWPGPGAQGPPLYPAMSSLSGLPSLLTVVMIESTEKLLHDTLGSWVR